jgi:hypothetical protein
MSDNNVWYLPGPFHRYEDDVKAIAKKNGLIIIDANVTPDRDCETDKPPKAKLKPEYEVESETDPAKMGVADLRDWLAFKGIEFDAKAPKADLVKLIPAE